MNIYDEALKELHDYAQYNGIDFEISCKALERAKKVEELLELYQLRDNYQSHTNEYHKIQKGIKTLEKELEELK